MKYLPTSSRSSASLFASGKITRWRCILFAGFCLGILLPLRIQAQDTDFIEKGTVYQIFLGRVDDLSELKKYALIQDLGQLHLESLHPNQDYGKGYAVFLGRYLGEAAVNNVVAELKNRRFSYEAIESNSAIFNPRNPPTSHISSSILVEARLQLNMRRYESLEEGQWDLYILYNGQEYQVLTQIHDPLRRPLNFFTFLDALEEKGFEPTPISFR